jgi:hypothetical protein
LGGGEFIKERMKCTGRFRYFPVWELEELKPVGL